MKMHKHTQSTDPFVFENILNCTLCKVHLFAFFVYVYQGDNCYQTIATKGQYKLKMIRKTSLRIKDKTQ